MAYTSRNLVHFVGAGKPDDDAGNWRTLESILRSGEILAGGKHGSGVSTVERKLNALDVC